jgi:hypothetical protein
MGFDRGMLGFREMDDSSNNFLKNFISSINFFKPFLFFLFFFSSKSLLWAIFWVFLIDFSLI